MDYGIPGESVIDIKVLPTAKPIVVDISGSQIQYQFGERDTVASLLAFLKFKKVPVENLIVLHNGTEQEASTFLASLEPLKLQLQVQFPVHPCLLDVVHCSRVPLWTSLSDALREKCLDTTGSMIVVCGVVLGMRFLHSKGLVHGNLNATEVLLDQRGYPCIRVCEPLRPVHCAMDVRAFVLMVTKFIAGVIDMNGWEILSFNMIWERLQADFERVPGMDSGKVRAFVRWVEAPAVLHEFLVPQRELERFSLNLTKGASAADARAALAEKLKVAKVDNVHLLVGGRILRDPLILDNLEEPQTILVHLKGETNLGVQTVQDHEDEQ
jgi:hypothetical protein